jgi:DNA-directed RNA polymerase specialized sigma24 family protein
MDSPPGQPSDTAARASVPLPPLTDDIQSDVIPSADEMVPGPDELAEMSERLRAELKLRNTLAAQGFAGHAYGVLADELAGYGYAAMMAWLGSGHIFARCREAGAGLRAERILAGEREDLAQETVVQALRAFRETGLLGKGWKPWRGATLQTYFTRALCLQFANIWRKRLRDRGVTTDLALDALPFDIKSPEPGPEDVAVQRDEIRRGMAGIRSSRTRAALALTEDGYEQDEIADLLGPGITTRGVEGYLRRHRRSIALRKEKGQ